MKLYDRVMDWMAEYTVLTALSGYILIMVILKLLGAY